MTGGTPCIFEKYGQKVVFTFVASIALNSHIPCISLKLHLALDYYWAQIY